MARPEKTGDSFYNARRRYRRAAERNLKKAEQSSGATAARYRSLALQDLNRALSTYDKKTTQDFSKPIKNLADKLGVNLESRRKQLKQMKSNVAARVRKSAEERSTDRLAGAAEDAEELRQLEARAVFSSGIGSRIIGGLESVWREAASVEVEYIGKDGQPYKRTEIDKKKMMRAIMDYFKVDNLADLLSAVEDQIGESLYQDVDSDELYETVKLTIQTKVADNTLVS